MTFWRRVQLSVTSALIGAIIASGVWIVILQQRGSGGSGGGGGDRPPPPVASAPQREAPAEVAPSGLVIPVAGVRPEQLVDTFTQARAGGARVHDAIDIMAPHGTPVVAVAAGTLEKLFTSENGGLTAYVRSPDRRLIYYYAHLQDYAPGLTEGRPIARGDAIGTVGSTGNASPDGPHLHFAIHRASPEQAWHEGEAINPYPLLARRR